MVANGAIGSNGTDPSNKCSGGGGGGGGGSIRIVTNSASFGSTSIDAAGGNGGNGYGSGPPGVGGTGSNSTAPGGDGNPDGGGGGGGAGRIRLEYCGNPPTGGTAMPPAITQQISCKPLPSGLNITKLGQYSPPKSCYNVYNAANQSTVLFQVCDNDWLGAPASNAACAAAPNDGICNDENPAQGQIKVTVSPGDYHIVESVAPLKHALNNTKRDCNASAGACSVTVTDVPIVRPWYPWDLIGGTNGAPDGKVRINDVSDVIQHYRQDKPLTQ